MQNARVWMRKSHLVWKTFSEAIVPIAALLLPKCGFCVVAYLNLFGLMGISAAALQYYKWVLPALSIILAIALFIGYIKAKRAKDYRLFIVQLAGAILLIVAKAIWPYAPAAWAGAAIIFISGALQLLQSRNTCSGAITGKRVNIPS